MGQRKLYLQYYLDYCHYMWRRRLIAGILVCLAMYWYRINTRKKKRAITYAPMLDRDVERLRRLDRLYHGTEAHCISELRMWKVVFHKLCAELRSRALLEDTVHVTIEEQVAMFIHVVGHNWSNRPIAFEFMRSGETVSRYFNIVLNALCILARNLICIRSVDTHPKITSSHGRFHPYSQGCIGALDGTHIPACVPIHMQDRFRGRKSFTSQNVLAAVDFDLRFLYVLAGWEGSAHDSYVLQDALSRPNGLKIPEAMTKRKVKVDAFASSRERSLTWHEDQTKFMLEWYMEYLKKQYAGFKIKKTHHMLCADGLNKKFAMGVTADQVDRHYRYHKENWKFIAATLSKSGNTFDHTRCLVTISESQKATLCDRARRLLSKPIKFFNEIQELFTRASADGSLAMDQNTCMDVSDGSDSDDSKDLLDLNCYTQPEDTIGEDSDTLPTPTTNATLDNNSSSTSRACKKRPRGSKSPIKKPSKKKSLFAESTNEISAMMKSLQETLAATAPPQMPQFTDPHAVLWQKLEAIPLIPDQRVLVGDYLSSKENKSKRGWLCNASDYTLHAWVFKFLCEKEGINL